MRRGADQRNVVLAAVFLLSAIVALSGGIRLESGPSGSFEHCVNSGVTHFIERGAYPQLPDGRLTLQTVRKRCILKNHPF